MWVNIRVWIKKRHNKIVNSIAFFPAIIAISFLALSLLSISFDFSEKGMQIKSSLEHSCKLHQPPQEIISFESECLVTAATSGIYAGFNQRILMRICNDNENILI